MSRASRRSGDAAPVPEMGDPDRKRILNVLAQRRYRKRKRDRITALEAQVKSASRAGSAKSPEEYSSTSPASETNSEGLSHTAAGIPGANESNSQPVADAEERQFTFAPSVVAPASTSVDWMLMPTVDSGPAFDSAEIFDQVDSVLFDFDPFAVSESLSTALSLPRSSSVTGSSPRQSEFSDDLTIDIPVLKLHTAGLELASLLGCAQQIFDPSVSRVLAPLADPRVPAWLQPTRAQQTIPHHPFIDILPWPSVRTRLLIAFSQPAHLRPPAAQDDNGLLRLMSDTDSEVEGCRVNGDGFQADDWEIGQSFFSNWWWALDPHIVTISNERRVKRGAGRLQLTAS